MKYLTILPNQGAGIGHQWANWNTAYYLSEVLGVTFVHRPFGGDRVEQFLGMGVGEIQYFDGMASVVNAPMLNIEKDGIQQAREIVASVPDETLVHLIKDQNMSDHTVNREKTRAKYWWNHTFGASAFTGKKTKVAVQVRRELPPSLREQRVLPYSFYINILNKLPIKDYELHIIGEGKGWDMSEPFDYDAFKDFDATFHIHNGQNRFDDDTWLGFHTMADSDILIMSRSGFPYTAGLFSYGIVIANPFWHTIPDGNGWVIADRDGNLDEHKLIYEFNHNREMRGL